MIEIRRAGARACWRAAGAVATAAGKLAALGDAVGGPWCPSCQRYVATEWQRTGRPQIGHRMAERCSACGERVWR